MSGKQRDSLTCREDAQTWLGLSDIDASWLFAARRTLPEIHAFAGAAAKGHPLFDLDGYNRWGYDREGYNRWGYDREGYDRMGRDREGKRLPLIRLG